MAIYTYTCLFTIAAWCVVYTYTAPAPQAGSPSGQRWTRALDSPWGEFTLEYFTLDYAWTGRWNVFTQNFRLIRLSADTIRVPQVDGTPKTSFSTLTSCRWLTGTDRKLKFISKVVDLCVFYWNLSLKENSRDHSCCGNDPEWWSCVKLVWHLCGSLDFPPPWFFTYGSESTDNCKLEIHTLPLIIWQENGLPARIAYIISLLLNVPVRGPNSLLLYLK